MRIYIGFPFLCSINAIVCKTPTPLFMILSAGVLLFDWKIFFVLKIFMGPISLMGVLSTQTPAPGQEAARIKDLPAFSACFSSSQMYYFTNFAVFTGLKYTYIA